MLSQMEGDMYPGGFLNKPINDLMSWESKTGRQTLLDILGMALQNKGWVKRAWVRDQREAYGPV